MRRRRALVVILGALVPFAGGCATLSLAETIESLLRQIVELLQARRYDEALVKVAEVIRRDPAQWKAYLYGAQAYIGQERWADAGRMLVDGLSRATDPAARTQLMQALLEGGRQALARGEYRGAATLLAEYVRRDPRNVGALLDLGKAYWNAGDRGQALDAFRHVLELAPGNAEARRFLLGQ